MFPTSSRSKTHQRMVDAAKAYQHESPPTLINEGSDSCYGVKSVSSWGEQSEVDLEIPKSDQPNKDDDVYVPEEDKEEEDNDMIDDELDEDEGESTPEVNNSLTSSNIIPGLGLGITSPNLIQTQDNWLNHLPSISQVSPSRPIHTKLEQRIIPPSPEDTVHPLEHQLPSPLHTSTQHQDINMEESTIPPTIGRGNQLTLDHITRSFDSPCLTSNTSEPSSPASFTSMPSYVASLSSLSRTSSISPMGTGLEYDQHHQHHHNISSLMTGSDELVLPTLSLPSESLSLHMSLSKWSGQIQDEAEGGLTIILLGERECIERTLRELKEVEHLVEIHGGVGIVRNGKIVLRLITSLKSVEQVQQRILYTYNTLNRLLHPGLAEDTSAQAELRRLVEGYIGRSDWIHAVLSLDNAATDSLEHIIPIIHGDPESSPNVLANSPDIVPKTPCVRHTEIEPTPRPSEETSGYFAPRIRTPSPASSRDSLLVRPSHDGAVQQIIHLLAHPSSISRDSIDKFLSWRSTQNQAYTQSLHNASTNLTCDEPAHSGERTMTSSFTSASSGVGAMPTVARAQGGGEWEATLSRRVAQRKESSDRSFVNPKAGRSGQSGRRRRSLEKSEREKEKDCLSPLFPISRGTPKALSEKGLGINKLLDNTFVKGIKKWTKGWRSLLVVGIVVAVGWGYWVSTK